MQFCFLSNFIFACVLPLVLISCTNNKDKFETAKILFNQGEYKQTESICQEILKNKQNGAKENKEGDSLFQAAEKLLNFAGASQLLESIVRDYYRDGYNSGFLSITRDMTETSGYTYNVFDSCSVHLISNTLVGSVTVIISGVGGTLGVPHMMKVRFCDIWLYHNDKKVWSHEKEASNCPCDSLIVNPIVKSLAEASVTAEQKQEANKLPDSEQIKKVFQDFLKTISLPDSSTAQKNLADLDSSGGFGPIKWKMKPSDFLALGKDYGYIDVGSYLYAICDSSIDSKKFCALFSKWNHPIYAAIGYNTEGLGIQYKLIVKYPTPSSKWWFKDPKSYPLSKYENQCLMSFVLNDPLKLSGVNYRAEVFFSRQYGGVFAITFKSSPRNDFFTSDENGIKQTSYSNTPTTIRYFGYTRIEKDNEDMLPFYTDKKWWEVSVPFDYWGDSTTKSLNLLSNLFIKYGTGNIKYVSFHNAAMSSFSGKYRYDYIYGKIYVGKNCTLEYGVQQRRCIFSGGDFFHEYNTTFCLRASDCQIPSPFIVLEHADEIIAKENKDDSLVQIENDKLQSDSIKNSMKKWIADSIKTAKEEAKINKKLDF